MLSMEYTTLFDGTVCYVTDISRIDKEYNPNKNDGWTAENASHYFILKNKILSSYCGFVGNDLYNCYGWKNITKEEIYNASSEDGMKVLYLESLIAEYKGNNPHVGYGQYDDGMSYLDKFKILFADNFENGVYDHLEETNNELYAKIPKFGFEISEPIADNKKCAYYHYYEEENTPSPAILGEGTTNDDGKDDTTNDEEKDDTTNTGSNPNNPQSGGFPNFSWNSSIYKTIKFPDTPSSSTGPADETQANGVINLKNIFIEFDINNNSEMKSYIQNVVLKYLEPMIPSTAIVEYGFKETAKMAMVGDTIMVEDGNIIEIPNAAHIMYKNNDE